MIYQDNRVPAQLLTPLEITGFVSYPVTLEAALVKIAELEKQVETANDRFVEIKNMQVKPALKREK